MDTKIINVYMRAGRSGSIKIFIPASNEYYVVYILVMMLFSIPMIKQEIKDLLCNHSASTLSLFMYI